MKPAEERELALLWTFVISLASLVVTLIVGRVLERRHIHRLPHSGVGVLIGALCAGVVRRISVLSRSEIDNDVLKDERFDARDAIGRCFGGRRLAFVGDSLAEQVSKALLGMLGHAGHAATKTEHGDVFSMDKAQKDEEFIARPKKRHPRYWKQRDFRRRLTESGMEVLERFKLGRVDLDRLEDIDDRVRFGPRDVILVLRAALQERQSLRERSAVLLRLDETRQR